MIQKTCPVCNKPFYVYPSQTTKKNCCSRKCSSSIPREYFPRVRSGYQDGEKNPSWKGGTARSTVLRRAKAVLDAAGVDQTICQQCGRESPYSRWNIHHKDGNRMDSNLNNLEVLCPICHNSNSPLARHTRILDGNGRFLHGTIISGPEICKG